MTRRLPPILPAREPVVMPKLPPSVEIKTLAQQRAVSDPIRSRILGVLQNVPATAKQLAERLSSTPGAIGHHLKLLERHGLVQIVARRQMRGIVANYYARTGRILNFNAPMQASDLDQANILTTARNELAEMMAEPRPWAEDEVHVMAYPHIQLSARKAAALGRRLDRLITDLIATPNEPGEPLYGIAIGMFRAPEYLQPGGAPAAGDQASSGASNKVAPKAAPRPTKRARP
ncbi:MAG: winged helix-turn-helix transcriptional regulator [Anaerolineales bacterium]|nr:winged helix-turn-helix transcriptional regulator [Anaerolineales bacterium]